MSDEHDPYVPGQPKSKRTYYMVEVWLGPVGSTPDDAAGVVDKPIIALCDTAAEKNEIVKRAKKRGFNIVTWEM